MQLEETRQQLAQEDAGYRRLVGKHRKLSARLDELHALRHPSAAEQQEEIRLKKQKLALKDQMEVMVQQAAT